MDEAQAKERMLEVENLTDALEDDDANWLLDWGTSHVGPLIKGISDDDQAGEKVNQLMGVMRSVNHITGDRNAAPPDELAGDVRDLVEKYNAAFSTKVNLSDEQIKALVGRIATLGERDAMQALLSSVEQPGAATSTTTSTTTASPASAPPASPAPGSAQQPPSTAGSANASDAKPSDTPSAATQANAGSAPPPQTASAQQTAPQAGPSQPARQANKQDGKSQAKQPGAAGQEESHA